MKSTSVLVEDQGVLGIGPAAEASLGRRNFLELMSAFTTPLLVSVRHGNDELGEVAPTTLTEGRDEPTILLLGGRSWRVTDVDWKKRIAWVEPSQEGGKSLWPGSSRSLSYALCGAIEAAVVARESSAKFSNRAQAQFEMLCDDYAFCDGYSVPIVVDGEGHCRIWTFAGSAVNGPLASGIAGGGFSVRRFDNYSIAVTSREPHEIARQVDRLDLSDCSPLVPAALNHALKFSICLPPGVASATLNERLRDEEGILATLARPIRLFREGSTVAPICRENSRD